MEITTLFWNASIEELKSGFIEQEHDFVCLVCGEQVEKGIVYPDDHKWYEARKFMQLHIERLHGSMFDYLVKLDKKLTGLTEHQKQLLSLFYQGASDAQIQKELGIGSASTIRNHRFALKEKEKQARLFLTMMELIKEKDKHAPTFVDVHRTAKMVDDRYNVTITEREKIIKKYFSEGVDGPITTFSMQEKHKLVVLREIMRRFEAGAVYTEKQVNQRLKEVFHDFVTLRRYMIEYGFLDRKPDCSEYWVKE